MLDVVPHNGECRLVRFERLKMCSPSADEVLEEMLSKRNRSQSGGLPLVLAFLFCAGGNIVNEKFENAQNEGVKFDDMKFEHMTNEIKE